MQLRPLLIVTRQGALFSEAHAISVESSSNGPLSFTQPLIS